MIKLVYFGSPGFSAQILEAVIKNPAVRVVGVVTAPDKAVGRRQILTPTPVAIAAAKYDLPVFKPAKLDQDHLAHLRLLKPDLFLVVSYGKIIPPAYLGLTPGGSFNIHFSLLPKYRGALPISAALRNGEAETGVSLMRMDEQLDHGPIISQAKVAIDIKDNCETLTMKLTQTAIALLTEDLPRLADSNFGARSQTENQASYTPPLSTQTRQAAFIAYPKIKAALNGARALTVHNLIRSANPEPGAWTRINGLTVKIIASSLLDHKLVIDRVQLPGKTAISWSSFRHGHPSA